MKRVLGYRYLAALILFSSPVQASTMKIGEQISLPIVEGTRFSVGNPEIIQVKSTQLQGGELLLLVKAKAIGYSDVLLFPPSGKQQQLSFQVSSQGASPMSAGSHDAAKHFSESELTHLVNQLNLRLEKAQLSTIRARALGGLAILEGKSNTKDEKELAELLGKELIPSIHSYVQNPFDAKETLRFKVQILELVKTKEDKTGLEWSEDIPGILQLHQGLLKANISLDASLHALARTGLVKILSEPHIALNAEGVAELKVGGEIPISLKSLHFSYVQWKPYGLNLQLSVPGVMETKARTNIRVELTTLDAANGQDGVPATKLNQLETVIDLPFDKPIFLSGLMQDQTDEEVKGLAGLSSIPILGALFRSKDFQQRKSELVIALTAQKVSY